MKTDRITPVLGPHAIYTVSKDSLLRIRELADKTGSLIHIHLSETKREVDDCLTETGARPAKYLDGLGFLAKDVIAAHGCWLDPSEIELLARTGTRVAHCPISNMKLSTRHNDISNWVYSAHGNVVDTMICDGVVLMRGRRVRGEAEILEKAAGVARDLVSRV